MVNTICQAAGTAIITTTGTVQYWKVAGRVTTNTAEANVQILFRSAGTFSHFLITLTGNTIASTTTINFRVNAASVNQVLSVGASTSGEFEDTTHTDTIAAGDKVSVMTPSASGTFSILIVSVLFAATTNTVSKLATQQPGALTTASTSWFFGLNGSIETLTEATTKCRMREAGTLKNMAVHVTTARATASTGRSRKNGANGNLSVSCTAASTGWFEDTTNSDTVSAGEDWNYSITTGTGVDTLQLRDITCEFISTTGDGVNVCSTIGPIVVTDNTNTNFYINGLMVANATESQTQTKARDVFTCSELTCLITQNDVGSASTLMFRVDAADSALTASITASNTGVFSDSTHTVTLTTVNDINVKLTVPTVSGTHTVTIANLSVYTNLATNVNLTTSITETVSISDSIARVKGANRPITETVNSTESIARTAVNSRALTTETTTLSDSIARVKGNVRTISTETVAVSDSIARLYGSTRALSTETVSSSESTTRLFGANRSLPTETVTITTGTVATVKGVVRTIVETVSGSDSLARLYAATRALPETVSSSDSIARLLGAIRALATQTTAISDSIQWVKGAARSISETVNLSDSLTRLYTATRTLSTETVSSNDSITRLLGAIRTLTTETIPISDSIARTKGVARSISETVNLSDSIARLLASSRAITETTAITGTVARLLSAIRTLATENTSISDSIATLFTPGAPGNNFVRAITETVNLSESIVRRVTNTRALSAETVAISDQLTRLKGAIRSITETVNISDSITRLLASSRAITENTTISDSIIRRLAGIRTLTAETVSISDQLTRVKGVTRAITETVNISDSIARLVAGIRTLPETINLSDSIQRVFSGTRAMAESVTSSSSVVTLRGAVRTLTENIAVSDSLTKVFAGIRTLTETVNLSDILQTLYSSAHAIIGLATGLISTIEKIEGKGPTNLRVYHTNIDIDRVPEPERDIEPPTTVSESQGRTKRRYINDPDLE